MQCPACGFETTPELPYCTRCNAPLVGPPGFPEGPEGETVTHLSPEPWATPEPWAIPQPEMWQPPPPRKRSPIPLVLAGAGAVVLVAVAAAIVFWPTSNDGAAPPVNSPAQQTQGTQDDQTSGDTPQLKQQAGQVDSLLTEMADTRTNLGQALTNGCQTAPLEQIRSQRQEQLAKAKSLAVDALENGNEMRAALVQALEASVESNQRYLDSAPGCPSEDEVQSINDQASAAKSEFIDYWRPNAERAGLDARDPSSI